MCTSVCGSEIARAIFAYLEDEGCERAAEWFCQESSYMSDEFNHIKMGMKIRRIRHFLGIVEIYKMCIAMQDEVYEMFDDELKEFNRTPEFEKMNAEEKLKLARRLFRKLIKCGGKCLANETEFIKPTFKRHFSAIADGEDARLPTEATDEQDLPGYVPPMKRRKTIDQRLIFCGGYKPSTSGTLDNVRTPAKTGMGLPLSATKSPRIPLDSIELLTTSILGHDFQNPVAESINNAIDNRNSLTEQLENVLPAILANTESYPTFEDIVHEVVQNSNNLAFEFDTNSIQSTSTPSKGSGTDDVVNEPAADRQLNTPDPMNNSIKQRLRPRKSNPIKFGETKRRSKAKEIKVLSNEIISGPTDVIVLNSDSEEAVSTTSGQPIQISQPTFLWKFDQTTSNYQFESQRMTGGCQTQTIPNNFNIPIVFESSSYPMQTIIVDPQTFVASNEMPPNQFIINSGIQMESVDDSRNRIILVDDDEVNAQPTTIQFNIQPLVSTQSNTQAVIPTEETVQPAASIQNTQAVKVPVEKLSEKVVKSVAQLQQTETEPKEGTPLTQVRTNILNNSKSLSTPRRNPHVRVLDFTTPARFPLTEIPELKNESSLINASKLFSFTPQNQNISSSMPSSAPAKVSAYVESAKSKVTKEIETITEESSSVDSAIPFGRENNEDTVISVGSDTPKVRKKLRRSCVRTLSSHKEINTVENEKRFKRVAKTKKKICDGSDNSNPGDKPDGAVEEKKTNEPEVDPLEQWKQQREMMKNPALFEQCLRESESKRQAENVVVVPNKRKSRRVQKKPVAKTKKKTVKKKNVTKTTEKSSEKSNESCKTDDVSFNSSMDTTLNSTQLRLEAQLLEDNLASAKKATPVKQATLMKKKKTPNKVVIKLMPSPKIVKISKSKKTPKKPTNDKNITEESAKIVEPKTDSDPKTQVEEQAQPAIELTSVDSTLSNKSTHEDLQVANDLINMKEIILKHEKQLWESAKKNDASSSAGSSTSGVSVTQATPNVGIQPAFMNMSSLETPFKNELGNPIFPRTPGVNSILQNLATPIIRSNDINILDVSIFKNPAFPTPSFPITPGSIFTPLKDLNSPRGDQEIVYGAANRPTDYSSSSSYYKPDESDGIDKQIQASISTRKNSSTYSADEFDLSRKDAEVVQDSVFNDESNSKMNSSSSSSSSSSDSDSDSDSSSSSSDSNASHVSQKSLADLPLNTETAPANQDDASCSTQIIKTHLTSTMELSIAQNILLAQPEVSAIDKEAEKAETLALMESKRLRIQERMRQTESQKAKPKQTSRNRLLSVKRNERFRLPTTSTRSPSKRKSTQPQKFVAQAISTVPQTETLDSITQQVISEAISDNAIVDASDVAKMNEKVPSDGENIEAIAEHVRQITNSNDADVEINAREDAIKMSKKRLVGILEGKQNTIKSKCDQTKAQVINALPFKKVTRSRAKLIINPAVIPKTATKKEPAVKIPPIMVKEQPPKPEVAEVVQEPSVVTPAIPSTSKPKDDFKTPAKDRIKQQIRDIFGDITDTETPIKSPPKKISFTKKVVEKEAQQVSVKEPMEEDSQNILKKSNFEDVNKSNADSSTANASFSDLSTDEYTSDEEEMEMVFSIDESDKKRFFSIRETSNAPSKAKTISQAINLEKFKKTIVIEDEKVILTVEPEDELFTQGLVKKATIDTRAKSSASSEQSYGRPLRTSTPSPSKQPLSPKPKFNIKHKSKDSKGQESSPTKTRQSATEKASQASSEEIKKLNKIDINDLLKSLHPTK